MTNQIEEILLDNIKEYGIVKIIMDYKFQMEMNLSDYNWLLKLNRKAIIPIKKYSKYNYIFYIENLSDDFLSKHTNDWNRDIIKNCQTYKGNVLSRNKIIENRLTYISKQINAISYDIYKMLENVLNNIIFYKYVPISNYIHDYNHKKIKHDAIVFAYTLRNFLQEKRELLIRSKYSKHFIIDSVNNDYDISKMILKQN